LYLKALAMLGSDTPAVKGMQPIEFKESEAVEYKFEEMPTFADDFAVDHFRQLAANAEAEKTRLQTELDQEKTRSQTFATEKEQLEFTQRKEKFESFLDEKTDAGILEPKIRDKALSLFEHLDTLSQKPAEDETTPVDLFKEIINCLPKQITFGEEFTDGEEPQGTNTHQLADEIKAYRQAQKQKGIELSFTQALNHVKNQKSTNK
jgi:hypothetical protein